MEYRAEKKQKRAAAKMASSNTKNFRPFDRHRGNGVGNATTTTRTGYTVALAYRTGFWSTARTTLPAVQPQSTQTLLCLWKDGTRVEGLSWAWWWSHLASPEQEAYVRKVEMIQLYIVYITNHMHLCTIVMLITKLQLTACSFVRNIVAIGYRLPLFTKPPPAFFKNHASARQEAQFVEMHCMSLHWQVASSQLNNSQ